MTDEQAADGTTSQDPPATSPSGGSNNGASLVDRSVLAAIGLGLAATVAVVAIAALLLSSLLGDEPDPVSLEEAIESDTDETTAVDDPGSDGSSLPATVDGVWIVDGEGDSFVGYRIDEEIAGIGANTAVGRTGEVTATVTVNGTVVEAVEIEADMTSLESDDGRRDRQLRSRGLETDTFPTATFVSTEPVDLGEVPGEGEPVAVSITGDFTLHGVANEVTVELEAQRDGERIVAVGSFPIALSDYDIEKPTGFSVLGIEDDGTAELQLFLVKQ